MEGLRGRFDLLPLTIQMPGEEPQLFELPPKEVLEVPLTHPDLGWFADLGLKWHAVPAISDMRMEIGGLTYPACPFNGWYVSFEIGARNLSDEDRYNQLPAIAERLGLDRTDWSITTWPRSRFVVHEERERRAGRATPAEWAWVVPPISGSTAPTFHRAYSPDPELSPNFHYQSPAWKASGELHSNDACPVAH